MSRWGEGRSGEGRSGRAAAHVCQIAVVIDRAEVVEEFEGAHERLGCRGVHEVKVYLHTDVLVRRRVSLHFTTADYSSRQLQCAAHNEWT